MAKKRAPTAGSWRPGISGNPGGRSKAQAEVQRVAREAFAEKTPDAIARLWALVQSDNERVSLEAVRLWLERGLGRIPDRPPEDPDDGAPRAGGGLSVTFSPDGSSISVSSPLSSAQQKPSSDVAGGSSS